MNSALKWGLILGGAAYLLKDQLLYMISGRAADTPPASSTPPASTGNGDSTQPVVDSAAITKAKLLAWAQAQPQYAAQGGLLDGWQWAYGYRAVRGTDPGDPGLFMDASRRVTLDEFWQLAAAHGLSGVPNWSARAWGYRG